MEWDLTNRVWGNRLRMDKMLTTKKSMVVKRSVKAMQKRRPKGAISGGYNS